MNTLDLQAEVGRDNRPIIKTGAVIAGCWRLGVELGRGGMGRVFAVTATQRESVSLVGSADLVPKTAPDVESVDVDAGEDSGLVVKLLETPELEARFRLEDAVLARLVHPGFPELIACGWDPLHGVAFSVRTRVPGKPLVPGCQGMTGLVFARIAVDLLTALDHLHRHGFVHGDIAPANALWDADEKPHPRARLIDLGAAARLAATADGTTSGIIPYTAPERLRGEALTPLADQWAVGALLWGLRFGVHPLPGYPAMGIDSGPVLPLLAGSEGSGEDGRVAAVLARFLAFFAADRFPDVDAAREALLGAMGLTGDAVGNGAGGVRRALPFVDRNGAVAAAVDAIGAAAERHETLVIEAPADGRTRWLHEVMSASAARDKRLALLAMADGDDPDVVIGGLRAALAAARGQAGDGRGRAVSHVEALLHSGAVLGFDDLDRRPALRAFVTHMAKLLHTQPGRYAPTVLVVAGSSGEAGGRDRWSSDDIEKLLAATWPGRRPTAGSVDRLIAVTGGGIREVAAVLMTLAGRGQISIDSAWLALPEQAVMHAALPVPGGGAGGGGLETAELRVLGLLAWADGPLAAAWWPNEIRGLRRAGAVVGGVKVGPASARWRELGHAQWGEAAAHAVLAELHEAAGDFGAAEVERLLSGEEAAVVAGAAALEGGADTGREVVRALYRVWEKRAGALAVRVWPALAERLAEGGMGHEAAMVAAAYIARATSDGDEGREVARACALVGRDDLEQTRYQAAETAFAQALGAVRGAQGADDGPALVGLARVAALAGLARAKVLMGQSDAALAVVAQARALLGGGGAGEVDGCRLGYVAGLAAWFKADYATADMELGAALAGLERLQGGGGLTPGEAAAVARERAAVLMGLGLVAHRRGGPSALEQAAGRYREALEAAEGCEDLGRVLGAMQNLGVVEHERGQLGVALDCYARALGLAETLEQPARLAQVAANLGNLLRYLGDAEGAAKVLQRALEAAEETGNRHAIVLSHNLLGDVAFDRGDFEGARQHADTALAGALALEMFSEATEIEVNRARLALAAGRPTEARAAIEAGMALAERHGQTGLRGQLAAVRAELHRSLGVAPDEGDRALLVEARMAITNSDARWPVLHALALLARDRGDWDEAVARAHEVMEILGHQKDRVPARLQAGFFERRDRQRAARDATAILATRRAGERGTAGGAGASTDWSRIIEVAKRVASERDVERLLAFIMDSAVLLTGAERGFLVLAKTPGDAEHVEVHIARNLDRENIRQKRDKISRGVVKRVIETAEPALTVDAMEDERFRANESVHDMKLRSILCVPMRFRSVALGAIYLDNRFQSAVFRDDDMRTMEALADLSAIALDNARSLMRLEAQRAQLEASRREVAALNERLAAELARRNDELEASREALEVERRGAGKTEAYAGMIGESAGMRRLFGLIDRLRRTDLPVLVEGESGTGKELVARAIHFGGRRNDRPFVAINCGAIPVGLIESELFGHVKGAFTSAHQDKRGLFEAADTGTLFLDEIGELPLEMQVRLLRVLQSGEFQKVGSTRLTRVDVRVVAATNRRLEDEIAAHRFREDLFYRLSVVRLGLPPLRERREDIPLLVRHFIDRHRSPEGPTSIERRALARLEAAEWPGNIRQLETVIRSALVFCDARALDVDDFPDLALPTSARRVETESPARPGGIEPLAEMERRAVLGALEALSGNKAAAARALGIDRRTLYNKLAAWGLGD